MPDDFRVVTVEADFPENGKYAARINGWQVVIVRSDDGYHAFNDRCSHAASPLSPGRVRRGTIMCPLHGARFDLATGACVGGTYRALRSFPLRLAGGFIEVAVPSVAPDMDELPIASAC